MKLISRQCNSRNSIRQPSYRAFYRSTWHILTPKSLFRDESNALDIKGLTSPLDPKPSGSDWGEGFLHYRTGGLSRLDVDTLNEKLQHRGAERLRNAQKPDEAYGMIFSFDGCIGNTRAALVRAAAQLAKQKGAPRLLPHQQQALALRVASMERIFIDVPGWTKDMKMARELSYELSDLYNDQLLEMAEPMPGMRQWIAALSKFNVPCALVSSIDRATVLKVLQRFGLHDFFVHMVTADDDMETISQRLLSASMKLNRPPNHCVLFGDSPAEITAAHNCTMKAVAVCSAYPAYNLKTADLTVPRLSELTVYNIRRLFAAQGTDFMEYCRQTSDDLNKNKKKRITNATI
ncbi:hypothetical protein CEUSTIGMA_g2173.t1 [Chlamydomonas eustigma]|uniref:Uncharacterized protein n=1 Tax=Chlamydomonas eustigma TaxID=1157962 RepID=A0A250WVE0_9CHLO|nr:hypothetical protein CEUSTIGMA_g2173.t1 [Chlamydomonas eustigma]|eukprot:GAX74726.1 hypothetical protein CEUSTIGMA_g2173.t1 [Chlamydomonas eustigma]